MMPSHKKKLLKIAEQKNEKLVKEKLPAEKVELKEQGDTGSLVVLSHKPMTETELVQAANLNPKIWGLNGKRQWTTTLKISDVPYSVWNYHYTFVRHAPRPIQQAVEMICSDWEPSPLPPVKKRRKKTDVTVEMSLSDAHFGKLCWDEATGQKNYDVDTASHDYRRALKTLVDRVSAHSIGEFLLPIGNDFFQTDNWIGTTTAGTPVSHDDRASKVFRAGFDAICNAIEELRKIAPVRPIWVPGNHDMVTSWHLLFAIAERFRSDKQVQCDLSPTIRKYIEIGDSVLCYQHGDKMKPERMVTIAATEFPSWSQKRFREIHCGHRHTRTDVRFVSASEHAGVLVRYLPSLSGCDGWHYEKGFVGNKRAAEAIVWHPTEGPISSAVAFID